ncbi:hypothetical protein DPMN_150329 [Dreissena polymorpha]|uniref:Uncharacterized protein n=1 Tax=Dreissena polymorpha TaxID=45954 RepID=A0A9D4J5W3_DREPO|nr:hypothetical protein DPMN_150329 [Dreissena polymorpha]
MHGKTIRRLRYSDITEYRTFPDNFILTPNKTDFEQLRFHKPPVEYSRTYPILKVAKQTTTGKSRWRLDSIPNLDRLPQQTLLPPLRKLPSREDTFDTDFMMPSRVREVLESEGLEHRVINGVIGTCGAEVPRGAEENQ